MKALKTISVFFFLLLMIGGFGFAQDSKVAMVQVGQSKTFYNTSEGASSWFWDFGDGTQSTEWHGNHVYEQPGEYTVRLTIFNGTCSKVYSQTLRVAEFHEPGSLLQEARLYPNPVVDHATLDLPTVFAGDLELQLRDGQGKLVRDWQEHVGQGQENLSLDFAQLATGMYFLELTSAQETVTLKVVKQ